MELLVEALDALDLVTVDRNDLVADLERRLGRTADVLADPRLLVVRPRGRGRDRLDDDVLTFFALAFDLGARLVLARVGAVPTASEADAPRRAIFTHALGELGRRADHRGLRLAVETGTEDSERENALRARIAELEAANADIAARAAAHPAEGVAPGNGKPETGNRRKTMPPIIGALLAKSGVEVTDGMDAAALDASLAPLSIEQRIAVKSQLAKAGLIV